MPREERRRQLLAVAREIFVVRGYHGTAMDDIAEAASVSKPVLYQHFPGKRELYLALLAEHLGELEQQLNAALGSTTDNKERVRATMNAYFAYAGQQGDAHRLIFETDFTGDKTVRDMLEAFNTGFAANIAEVISSDTHMDAQRSLLLGRALAGLATQGTLQWLRTEDGMDAQEAADLIYRLAWRGISRFPKES